jgi:hypothetical protein
MARWGPRRGDPTVVIRGANICRKAIYEGFSKNVIVTPTAINAARPDRYNFFKLIISRILSYPSWSGLVPHKFFGGEEGTGGYVGKGELYLELAGTSGKQR